MAVPVNIALYAPVEEAARRGADAAFARIRALDAALSDYDPASEVRRLCETATGEDGVSVSPDLWAVLSRAQPVSEASGGAFDVTIGPVVRLWRYARRLHEIPEPDLLRDARSLVDYRFVRLDPTKRAVHLAKPGMRIDLGGIAKGYAADEALEVLRERGIPRALVALAGDMALGDPPPDQRGWRIRVAPRREDGAPARYLCLARCGVSTSGDMYQYVTIGGRRYSHIVDPRTGLGLTDQSSVTIVAPDGMTADALASAVSVLGPERGQALIEATPGAAGLIARAPDGKEETYASKRWNEIPIDAADR